MGKRKNDEDSSSGSGYKSKRADLNGFGPGVTEDRIKQLQKVPHKGDWRRSKIIRIPYVAGYITWKHIPTQRVYVITTPTPCGMTGLLEKLESAANRNFDSLPLSVKEHFQLTKGLYKPENFKVEVSYADEKKYDTFHYLYCRLCQSKSSLKKNFWDKFPEKLPNEVSEINLLQNWDKLGLSWNNVDVLGCILPNKPEDTVVINARRFVSRAIEHWQSVHLEKDNSKKPVQKINSFFKSAETGTSSSGKSLSTQSSQNISSVALPTMSSPTLNLNLGHRKKFQYQAVDQLLDPHINLKHAPENIMEEFAIGQALRTVHVGANKMISNNAILENYETSVSCLKEYHGLLVSISNTKDKQDNFSLSSLQPQTVRLNTHNINDAYSTLYKTYRETNEDTTNPYRILEKANDYSLIHDATSHWVKEINTIFVRAVTTSGDVHKVPYSMKKVPGSFTGEVLCEELMTEISNIKIHKQNSTKKIAEALAAIKHAKNTKPEFEFKKLHTQLKDAASKMEFNKLPNLQAGIEALLDKHHQLQGIDVDTIVIPENYKSNVTGQFTSDILPTFPEYFKISDLKGIDEENNKIMLQIQPHLIPTSVCGDGCAVNLKGSRLAEEKYGLKSPFSRCNSHSASGTIRRATTSKTMSHPDAVALFENLRKVLKHFSRSPKSTELLNNALNMLEQNDIHMLVWGGTRMAGFLDACMQSSKIIIPFLDTLVTGKIRPDETAFLASPKGVYLMQLFADLHTVFANKFLHCVDNDTMLICEAYHVAEKTAATLSELPTPKADAVLEGLSCDNNNNILLSLDYNNGEHTVLLSSKLLRGNTLDKVKEKLQKMKEDILKCLVDNIRDQNETDSLSHNMSAFNLETTECKESRMKKVDSLFQCYGIDLEHQMEEAWNGYDVTITYKRRIKCSRDELLSQFETAFEVMGKMSKERREAKARGEHISQHTLWKGFIKDMEMPCPDLCDLIRIMISVAVNSGWVERSYSYLEMVCQKKRNRLNIGNLKDLFFLAILKLPPKECLNYKEETKTLQKI